jgi:hypothetical protein
VIRVEYLRIDCLDTVDGGVEREDRLLRFIVARDVDDRAADPQDVSTVAPI